MTCRDCIHYDVCPKPYYGDKICCDDVEDRCKDFKNKADFVEVVRCGKCKHGERYVIDNDTFLYKCRKIGISGFTEDFYCSYGERSEL